MKKMSEFSNIIIGRIPIFGHSITIVYTCYIVILILMSKIVGKLNGGKYIYDSILYSLIYVIDKLFFLVFF